MDRSRGKEIKKDICLSDLVSSSDELNKLQVKNLLTKKTISVLIAVLMSLLLHSIFFNKFDGPNLSNTNSTVLTILITLISGFVILIGQSFFEDDRYLTFQIFCEKFDATFNLVAFLVIFILWSLNIMTVFVFFLSIFFSIYVFYKIIDVFVLMKAGEKRILEEEQKLLKQIVKKYVISYSKEVLSKSFVYREIDQISKESFQKIKVDQISYKKSHIIKSQQEGYIKDINFTKLKKTLLKLDGNFSKDKNGKEKNRIQINKPLSFTCSFLDLSIGKKLKKTDELFLIEEKLYNKMKEKFSTKELIEFERKLVSCVKTERKSEMNLTLLGLKSFKEQMIKAINNNNFERVKDLAENVYRPILNSFSEAFSSAQPLIKKLKEALEKDQIIFWQREIYFSEVFLDFIKHSISIKNLDIAEELIKKPFLFFKDALNSDDLILFKTFFDFFSRIYDLSYSEEREYDEKTREKLRNIIRKNISLDVKWTFFDFQKLTDIKRFQLFLTHILSTLSFIIKMSFDHRDKKSFDVFVETFFKCEIDDDFSESSEEKRFLKEKKEHYLFNLCAYALTDPKPSDIKNLINFDEQRRWKKLLIYSPFQFIKIYERYKEDQNQREIDERDQNHEKSKEGRVYRPSSRDMATDYLIYKILDSELKKETLEKEIAILSMANTKLILKAIEEKGDNPPKKLEDKIGQQKDRVQVLKEVLEDKINKEKEKIRSAEISKKRADKYKENSLKSYTKHRDKKNLFFKMNLYKKEDNYKDTEGVSFETTYYKTNFIEGFKGRVAFYGGKISALEIESVLKNIRNSIDSNHKTKVKKENLESKIKELKKDDQNTILIAGGGAYHFYLKEKEILKTKTKADAKVQIKDKQFDTFVIDRFEKFSNKILILNKEKIGKVMEYNSSENKESLLDHGMSLEIKDFNKDEIALQKGVGRGYTEELLREHVLVEIRKNIEFVKAEDFWGYEIEIEDIGGFYSAFLDE